MAQTWCNSFYGKLSSKRMVARMFDDLFDFGKKRTLKQSIGFFLFHGGLITLVIGFLKVLGVS